MLANVAAYDIFFWISYQITMSTETEERVGLLLKSSNGTNLVQNNSSSSSGSAPMQSKPAVMEREASLPYIDTDFERLSIELKQKQEKMRVYMA